MTQSEFDQTVQKSIASILTRLASAPIVLEEDEQPIDLYIIRRTWSNGSKNVGIAHSEASARGSVDALANSIGLNEYTYTYFRNPKYSL